jgi:Ser/Thr protein kinase RdoA (MazF antagonist)
MMVVESPPIDAILERIADEYGFESVTVERELAGGMFSRPLLLRTDRGRFVRRVHAFRNSEPAFRFQAEAIAAAWRQGVACSRVEPTCRGEWCIPSDDGEGVVALHHFVGGSCNDWTTWYHRKQSGDGFLRSLGRQVAELHNALAQSAPRGVRDLNIALPPIQFRYVEEIRSGWCDAVEELRRERLRSAAASRDQFLSLEERIESHWERLTGALRQGRLAELPMQIVHGDVSPVNMVFESDDRPAFIDWDCVHIGHRMYDALGDVLNRPPDDRPDFNCFNLAEVEAYIDGYASGLDVPLAVGERRMAPAFCLARQLEDLRQRLRVLPKLDNADDERYARLIGMRVEMMDQIELTAKRTDSHKKARKVTKKGFN